MPGPYVDLTISTRRGHCKDMKRMTGTQARTAITMITSSFPQNVTIRATQKATIMAVIEMKSMEIPIISFVGKDLRKSCSA